MPLNRSIYTVTKSLDEFDPSYYFQEYHNYEEFDENKTYANGYFEKDFGRGNLVYENCLYEIGEINNHDKTKKFVVPMEILSDEQQKLLTPYCQCSYHTTSRFNPLRWFICPCCVGCIESFSPSQGVINRTRGYMARKTR